MLLEHFADTIFMVTKPCLTAGMKHWIASFDQMDAYNMRTLLNHNNALWKLE